MLPDVVVMARLCVTPCVLYPVGCFYCGTGREVDGPETSSDDLKARESQRPSDARSLTLAGILKANYDPWPVY